ncbi:rhodanese-like domain protein [Synechococcus sp. PCC 7335]|uniref:rhodanese-like domain-containing protein n=1 Tax=Synechococcus sp. (strain ATCC 29403 / PCC 7335) TaxID=91464 RepID=UPI00017EB550|nr:rhodanese-like domain-containing protein [Synechococcus sp. PCC 7335]EDX83609.1 rhodanese-like domain protein [Synechococcus sp. PCC 7335]
MPVKRPIAFFAAALLCFTLWLGVIPTPLAKAAPLEANTASAQLLSQLATTPTNSSDFAEVETFLVSLPNDYYTIKRIDRVKKSVENGTAMLVDVREPNEFAAGHIEGAVNIPLRTLTTNLKQIPQTKPVILYCSSGYRTGISVMTLRLLGYDNVRGFPPSIQGWKEAGEQLVTSK